MSKPTSDSDHELSAEALELLARVRRARSDERAPDGLRQRVLSRASAEVARPPVPLVRPPAPLVTIARPWARLGSLLLAAVALGLGLLVSTRLLMRSVAERKLGPEPSANGNWQLSGPAGELLAQSPLLRRPLLPLAEDQRTPPGPSLFGERPFARPGEAWQVRRWGDPKTDPDLAAAYDFNDGALCVTLEAAQRVIGGWPWPAAGAAPPDKVRLTAGRSYRLAFTAWVRGPLPSQLLVGVGHSAWPFVAAAGARVQVSGEPEPFAMDFVAQHDDDSVGVAFLAANGLRADATRVCLSDVSLSARPARP
jgi:hypothetical protein